MESQLCGSHMSVQVQSALLCYLLRLIVFHEALQDQCARSSMNRSAGGKPHSIWPYFHHLKTGIKALTQIN